MTALDRAVGTLLGFACGDAVGTTLEFRAPGTFEPISEIVGGGPFRLKPGEWTDDTSMALCLAESLLDRGDLDLTDQLRRYVLWHETGYRPQTDAASTSATPPAPNSLGSDGRANRLTPRRTRSRRPTGR